MKKVSRSTKSEKRHSWRPCPPGEHWVRTHPLTVPPSKKNPIGSITTRHGHCANNPTGKDQLYPDEIQEMAEQNFDKVKEKPCPLLENKYDNLIAGWTKYWNDVLKPQILLDPDLVKALIASESGFKTDILAKKNNKNSARGLMQITNDTRKILGNEKGELKDHFLTLTREDLDNPTNNISAGIRWLFRKQAIASSRLKRNATWEEAVAEFKGTRVSTEARKSTLMDRFNKILEKLKKCGGS